MHPYDHARSSARLHGGRWHDYYACHAWFDATKVIQCRFTHRALRHHREALEEAISVLGPTVRNVPPAVDALRRIKGARWMLQATSARKLGLD